MHWLCFFIAVDPEDPIPTFRKSDYHIKNYLSNAFLDVVRETFILWNNNQDEDQQQRNQERLINEYVNQRTGMATAKEATRETKKIKSEITKLHKERVVVCPKQNSLLESQQAKHKKLKQDEQKYKSLLQEKKKTLQQLGVDCEHSEVLRNQLEETKQQLEAQIKQQSMSKTDFNTLLELCAEKRNRNKAMRETNAHLAGIEYKKKLLYSQQLKQMSECVAKLNMFVHEVAEILQLSSFQHLCVDTRSSVLQVSLPPIVRCLEEIVTKNLSSHDELSALLSQLRIDLQQVNGEMRVLQSELDEMTKECASLHERRLQLDQDGNMTGLDRLNMRNDIVKSIDELEKQNAKLLVELKAKRASGLELAKENERLLQETDDVAHSLIAAKEARITEVDAATKELAEVFAVVQAKWEVVKQIGAND